VKVLSFVNEGSRFIFGSLMDVKTFGFIFACQVCRPSSSSPR
jgi:CNT family concentrative nucleoside transporter